MEYKDKVISIEKALSFVKSDLHIFTGLGAGEAQLFMDSLPTIADKVENVTITNCLPLGKGEYLKRLKRVFAQDVKNLIHVEFTSIELTRHPNPDPEFQKIYFVTLHQKYRSGTYNDDGYLLLIWDFTNEERPMIHVRAWQPTPFKKDFIKDFDFF